MSGWHKGRLAVLDTETTAPDPEVARIVTICTGLVGGGEPSQVVQTLVSPGVPIPAEATAVHGVTDEMAAAGMEPGAAAELAVKWLADVWACGLPVVAYNAAYDLTVIDREARRHLGYGVDVTGPVVDPFVIDREVDKYRKGKRTLTVTSGHYRVALDGAHDATEDALAAGRVAWRIAELFPKVAAMSLAELHEAQVGWHRVRQDDFAAYLRRKGESAVGVCGDWPLRVWSPK